MQTSVPRGVFLTPPFLHQDQRMNAQGSGNFPGVTSGNFPGIASGNSEGGRLRRETRNRATCAVNITVQNGCLCVNKNTIQAPITPTQGSRIASLQYACDQDATSFSGVSSYGVSQSRVQQILAKKNLTFATESARIASLAKQINECNSSMFHVPLIPILCPPLPPPPAPPARACPLTKNQKMS